MPVSPVAAIPVNSAAAIPVSSTATADHVSARLGRRASRSVEQVELAVLDAPDERLPLLRRERENRPRPIFAVPHPDNAGKVLGHLDAGRPAIVAASRLTPDGAGQVCHDFATS